MIAVIVVGYNSQIYLKDCFSYLKRSTHEPAFIIYVDNASSDGSVAYLTSHYPDVLVIKNKHNYGFAKANNIGIAKAIELGARYVFILNPDTFIDRHCLENLQKCVSDTTILQPLILLYDKRPTSLLNTTGGVLTYLGFSYCSDYRKRASQMKEEKEIALASGAGMLIPVSILKHIGTFDETFFMYHEDVDLSWRARIAGYNIRLIPSAKLWHKYQFGRNEKKTFFSERNRLLFLFKNFELKSLLLLSPMLLINELILCLYFLWEGQLKTKLEAYKSVLANWAYILRERKKIQKLRIVRDKRLSRYLKARIEFSEINIPFIRIYNKLLSASCHIVAYFM